MLWIKFFFYFVLFLCSCLISFLFGFVELFWIECFRISNHSTFLNWLVCFFLTFLFLIEVCSICFCLDIPKLISYLFGFVCLIHLFSLCIFSWISNLMSVPGRFAKHIINWRLFHLLFFRYPQLISFYLDLFVLLVYFLFVLFISTSKLVSVLVRFLKHIINWSLFFLFLFRYPQMISFLFGCACLIHSIFLCICF